MGISLCAKPAIYLKKTGPNPQSLVTLFAVIFDKNSALQKGVP